MREQITVASQRWIASRSTRIGIALAILWCAYLVVAQPWERSPVQHMSRDNFAAKLLYMPLLAGINVANGLDWINYRGSMVTLNPADVTAVPAPPPGAVIDYPSVSEFIQQEQGFSPLRIGVGILIVFGIAKLPAWVFRRKPHA